MLGTEGPLPDRNRSFKERLGLAGFALARVEDSETYLRPGQVRVIGAEHLSFMRIDREYSDSAFSR